MANGDCRSIIIASYSLLTTVKRQPITCTIDRSNPRAVVLPLKEVKCVTEVPWVRFFTTPVVHVTFCVVKQRTLCFVGSYDLALVKCNVCLPLECLLSDIPAVQVQKRPGCVS